MNDSVLIKTKMVTIGADTHLLIHTTACADFDSKFERKIQSTRFHQTSQANPSHGGQHYRQLSQRRPSHVQSSPTLLQPS